jgi:hypothetical protein
MPAEYIGCVDVGPQACHGENRVYNGSGLDGVMRWESSSGITPPIWHVCQHLFEVSYTRDVPYL